MRWINLEPSIQSEVSQKEKHQQYINAYIMESRRMVLTNLFTEQQRRRTHRGQTYAQGLERRGRGWDEWRERHGCSNVKVTQSCLTLCNPMDYTAHGILQARILDWVAFPFSIRSSQPRNWTGVSCIAGGFFTNWAISETLIAFHFHIT